jgi:predicted nucleic acid-binding protein
MPTYLADTSAWLLGQRRNAPSGLRKSFADLVAAGEIALCGPVQWELLHSSNNAAEFESRREDLDAFDMVPIANADWQRALDIGHGLAKLGGSLHRAPSMPDVMVAVAAERAGLTVLHYDKDFDLIADVTGQHCRWVAPKGSL